MIVRRPPAPCVLLGFLALQMACGGKPSPSSGESYTVTDSAGIEIVTNHLPLWQPGEEWRIEGEPFLVLGEIQGEPSKQFTSPTARRFSDGRILVSEQGERELRLFSADGEWLWTAGGRGDGPGEFKNLQDTHVLRGDTVLVFDRPAKRASWFDSAGQFIRSERFAEGGMPVTGAGGTVLDSDIWLIQFRVEAPDSAGLDRWQNEILLMSSDGQRRATLDTLTTILSHVWRRGNYAMFEGLPFFSRPILAAGNGRAYVSDATSWNIQVFDSNGRLDRLIRRDWTPEAVTESDVDERLARQRKWGEDRTTSEDRRKAHLRLLEKGARLSETKPALSDCFVDREGNLWTLDWAMPERGYPERQYNVFDSKGVGLGPVTVPAGMRLTDVGEDYVLGTVSDDLGILRVYARRLIKPPDSASPRAP